jgi:hypothetical protein
MFSPVHVPINWDIKKNYTWLRSVKDLFKKGLISKEGLEKAKQEHAEYEESRRNTSDEEFNKLLMKKLESKF